MTIELSIDAPEPLRRVVPATCAKCLYTYMYVLMMMNVCARRRSQSVSHLVCARDIVYKYASERIYVYTSPIAILGPLLEPTSNP